METYGKERVFYSLRSTLVGSLVCRRLGEEGEFREIERLQKWWKVPSLGFLKGEDKWNECFGGGGGEGKKFSPKKRAARIMIILSWK